VRFSFSLSSLFACCNPQATFAAAQGCFLEFASQGHQTSAEHARYILEHPTGRCDIMWLRQVMEEGASKAFSLALSRLIHWDKVDKTAPSHLGVKEDYHNSSAVFVSFDLDAVSSADAPVLSVFDPHNLFSGR